LDLYEFGFEEILEKEVKGRSFTCWKFCQDKKEENAQESFKQNYWVFRADE
jgi:hypothetical protein